MCNYWNYPSIHYKSALDVWSPRIWLCAFLDTWKNEVHAKDTLNIATKALRIREHCIDIRTELTNISLTQSPLTLCKEGLSGPVCMLMWGVRFEEVCAHSAQFDCQQLNCDSRNRVITATFWQICVLGKQNYLRRYTHVPTCRSDRCSPRSCKVVSLTYFFDQICDEWQQILHLQLNATWQDLSTA